MKVVNLTGFTVVTGTVLIVKCQPTILNILTRYVRITYFIRLQQRNLPDFMYFINVNILGSQCAQSTNDLVCYIDL